MLELSEHYGWDTGRINTVPGILDIWRRNECARGISESEYLIRIPISRRKLSRRGVHSFGIENVRGNVLSRRFSIGALICLAGF